ncbi:glutathione synthetase-like [Syngnathus typhle]|uniref:glutathione synthetase-like n=1 Tax=Syngnathus typhle TaxID=161592 RepID=UPI002A69F47B|nr:glutathione synthetase-like [Syngnathus typhle]XP_061121137.1 glutathione synthetase-like [Syngnathus typhle]XP_061121138.1 glutathione synthetase-like [Syngnathus typhle]XP_061121139.1 glutathione synthetase-like [Syngnathus typhle]XP_061121140.1 glutathione synthetase-like [Syngnathus typhle]XP_061121141.1 glutathione synthetase-like [Syngnathus typhle]XP_061121142.1 glutathione synthetase-like [Syngnathus typhle]
MANGVRNELLMNTTLIDELAQVAKESALVHGILMRLERSPNSSEEVTYAPITLFPTPVPRAIFLQGVEVQTHYNILVDKISQDPDFLEEALASTVSVDDFTARLFEIHRQVLKNGRLQSIGLGLNRSDYMWEQENGHTSLKQIEINTFAAAGGGMASHISDVHRHILQVAGKLEESQRIIDNNPAVGLTKALAKAWELYGSKRAVVMFVVKENEINIMDQRVIENELWKGNITTIRKRFEDISESGRLDGDKRLFVDYQEVAVVYFRHGYMPQHYKSEKAWDARLMMEGSLAVKCPDISTHLAGTKKVQQVLAKPGVLERFFPDQPQVVEQLRATFTSLYSLDMGAEGDKAIEMALATPDRFVLKPQREGGGNNIYGQEICEVLDKVKSSAARMAYILMEKIRPGSTLNYLLRMGRPLKISNCVSELGFFGTYVRHGKDMLMNDCVGYLMRTKSSEYSDGGVASGAAVRDSVFLF